MPVNVPVDVWLAEVRSLYCPACGAGYSALLISFDEALRTIETEEASPVHKKPNQRAV
jgi:hypothetical protein